mmetsp:Transcript_20505/g.60662  ORF Transcript_20505/g.60662 Transcript_20505/m.60662 type:complete len:373 (+) Transcript_20505:123-1241(+)
MRYGSTCRPQPESRRELSLADYALGADLAEVDVLVVCARGEDGLGGVEGDLVDGPGVAGKLVLDPLGRRVPHVHEVVRRATRHARPVRRPRALEQPLLVVVLRAEEELLAAAALAKGADVPAAECVVHSVAQQPLPVGRERDARHDVVVPPQFELRLSVALAQVVHAHAAVDAARVDLLAVGGGGDGRHGQRVVEHALAGADARVPHPRHRVVSARDDERRVGGGAAGVDKRGVPLIHADAASRLHIPQRDELVGRRGDRVLRPQPVDLHDRICVALEREHVLALAKGLPQQQRLVVRARQQQLAPRAELHRVHRRAVAGQQQDRREQVGGALRPGDERAAGSRGARRGDEGSAGVGALPLCHKSRALGCHI